MYHNNSTRLYSYLDAAGFAHYSSYARNYSSMRLEIIEVITVYVEIFENITVFEIFVNFVIRKLLRSYTV